MTFEDIKRIALADDCEFSIEGDKANIDRAGRRIMFGERYLAKLTEEHVTACIRDHLPRP